jgi:hypothetical protein
VALLFTDVQGKLAIDAVGGLQVQECGNGTHGR